tara:strand:- start:2550 stop:3308 length:759 start_codon:yes stop_codon:yes gene_type:complete
MEKRVKESLFSLANKLSTKQIFILFAMTIFLWFMAYQALPYLERRSAAENRVANIVTKSVIREQAKNKKMLDSIKLALQKENHKQAFINIDKIYDLMSDARKIIPTSNAIVVYYLHDSGGVPVSGSPLNVTVLYEAVNKDIPSLKKDWQSQPLPEGYFHYNKFIYDRGFKYINDVSKYEKIYNGETAAYFDMYGTKALYGVLLDQSTAGTYYISIAFPEPDPFDNDNLIESNIKRIASRLRPLLQLRQAPLY